MAVVLALYFVLGASAAYAADAAARPNVVFILIDDLRHDALSCTGHPFVQTPNIDRIAREGATFRNAFVTTPLCLPSRGCFLTGQYAHTHGVKGNADFDALGYSLPSFPRLLQRAGYETAFLGKWHIGDDARPRPGFDRWVSFLGQGVYEDPTLNEDGKTARTPGYLTDLLTDRAIDFIEQDRDKPFLLCLSHKGVHAPFIPAERHRQLFADAAIVRPASEQDDWSGKPILKRPGIRLSPKDPDVHSSDEMIRNQLRCLVAVDESIERLLASLERKRQLERTVVIFTSDHGYFWGEHGLGGKHGPYEEALRIPLLVRYPPLIKPGTKIDAFALNIDLAPTVIELAGLPAPPSMQGRSWVPLFEGQRHAGWRSSFLAEFFLGNGTNRFPTWQAIRTDRWKYIRYPEFAGCDELYDLASDPAEMRNLIQDPAAQDSASELRTELAALIRATSQPAP